MDLAQTTTSADASKTELGLEGDDLAGQLYEWASQQNLNDALRSIQISLEDAQRSREVWRDYRHKMTERLLRCLEEIRDELRISNEFQEGQSYRRPRQ